MKRYTHVGFIVSLFFALLIAAFILLFSYAGWGRRKSYH